MTMTEQSIFELIILFGVLHIFIVSIVETIVKTKHKSFWWGFFFTAPIGLIITLLLDIKDGILSN